MLANWPDLGPRRLSFSPAKEVSDERSISRFNPECSGGLASGRVSGAGARREPGRPGAQRVYARTHAGRPAGPPGNMDECDHYALRTAGRSGRQAVSHRKRSGRSGGANGGQCRRSCSDRGRHRHVQPVLVRPRDESRRHETNVRWSSILRTAESRSNRKRKRNETTTWRAAPTRMST